MNRYQQYMAALLFFLLSSFSVAQMTVSGTVTDASTGSALPGANVVVNGTEKGSAADVNGSFKINNVPSGATLTASMIGYSDVSMSAASTVNFKLSASALEMSALDVVANKATYRKTPVAFTDLNEEELQLRVASQDLTMVMNETPGVYATNGGGGAGDSYLYVRGFDQRNTAILINGVPVNDMENGWVYWSNWDGMSDVTSSIQIQRGLGASNLAIGSVGGTINVRTSAAEQESGGSFKQETGSYNFQKSTLTYHTGLSNSGFALSALLQRKTGSGYAYGTWTDAYAYFLTASKTFKNSLLDVYVLGAPQQHGQRDGDNNHPFETWNDVHGGDLRTNSGYNGSYDGSGSGWGYVSEANAQKIKTGQSSLDAVGSALFGNVLHTRKEIGGDKWMINNRTNYYHKPVYGLNFKYDVNDKTTISNVLYYSTGRGGGTGPLNSRGTGLYADDSLHIVGNDTTLVNFYSEASVRYINPDPDSEVPGQYDWDGFIDYNTYVDDAMHNPIYDIDGDDTTLVGYGSHTWMGTDTLSSQYATLQWNYGRPYDRTYSDDEIRSKAIIRGSVNHHDWYGSISTLTHDFSDNLKGTFALDARSYTGEHYRQVLNLLGGDYFIDLYGNVNDTDNDSKMKRVGDQIAYHNIGYVKWLGYSSQLEYSTNQLSTVLSLARSSTIYQREDRHNYTQTQAMSAKAAFDGHAYKVGANYNVSDNLNVFANFGRLQTAPKFNSVFLNYVNDVNPKANPEKVQSMEFGVGYNTGNIRANFNYYNTDWMDKSLIKSSGNSIFNIEGIDAKHSGVELDFKMGLMKMLSINTSLSIGNWTWNSDIENVTVFDDYNRGGESETISIYTKGVHVGGAPQTQLSLGLDARPIDGLVVYPVVKYFNNMYADFDPADRTSADGGDSYKADAATIMDIHTTYSLDLMGYNMSVGFHALNLLDTEYVNTALDGGDGSAEGVEVFYGLGRRINLSLGINF